ncbi:MAG: energy-coupling factor ABC transporter ATP-binding protein [Promethearchaeota archaeon]
MKISTKYPIILVKDVEYAYPNKTLALRGIDLSIFKGELVAIMGKNGAGKSTLIRTFNGLIRPSKGDIFIKGQNAKKKTIAGLSSEIGVIFQNPLHQLFSNTLEDEIKFSLNNLNLDENEIEKRINATLNLFNLDKYRNRSPLNLSGGETKKLAIATMICRDPEILVFDEPTLGQDAKEIKFFINLVKNELSKGKTIVIVTHNIEFTMEYIPRVILMSEGKIIADGPTKEVLSKELLINESSLILPKLYEFNIALNQIGIYSSENIRSKKQLLEFLKDFLKNKPESMQEGI